jgi:signal transduction histidine kinase
VSQEPRYTRITNAQTRSELAVPIKLKESVTGVINVESDRLDRFDDSDLVVLQSLAHQAAIAIENARLYEQAQQLAAMEERTRLARDLHDAVTQTLFSASLIAEALPVVWDADRGEGEQLLHEVRQLNRGALAEMRTLLLELRPAALAETGLADLLRQLCEAVTGRTGLPVSVTVDSGYALPPDVHVALYRIAQEALNNVVKHAQASEVAVSLRPTTFVFEDSGEQQDVFVLQVSDDGRGFDPSHVRPDHLGLGIIRERAQTIGATLTIDSRPHHGTQITVVWPADV